VFCSTGADDTAAMLRQEGGKAFSYKCDISNCDDVYATAKKVRAEVGKVSPLLSIAQNSIFTSGGLGHHPGQQRRNRVWKASAGNSRPNDQEDV
jgi:hypothetical protein